MQSEVFEGNSAVMRQDSPWLASEDILGIAEVSVTIEQVYLHKGVQFEDGRKRDVLALAFNGKKKQLVLNNTNRKRLVEAFGPKAPGWRGQKIILYVQSGIRKPGGLPGETCTGIRIRIPQRR